MRVTDLPHQALVAVALLPLNDHLPSADPREKCFLRPLTEGLTLLGAVNAREPDALLLVPGEQDHERIAVDDSHRAPRESLGPHV